MNPTEQFARFTRTDGLRDQLKARSISGALYSAGGSVGDFIVRLVSTSVLARLVIPEHFGMVAMVTAVTAIAGQIGSLGLSAATVQRRDIDHQQVTNLFWINVGFGLLLALILCALSPVVAAYYHDPRLIPITLVISTSFLWGGLTAQHEALLSRQMKQAQSAIVRLSATFLSVVVAVVLAWEGAGYWALVWQEVARSFLIALGVWLFCPWRPGLPDRQTSVGSFLRFGRDLTVAQLLNTFVSNLDRLLIGRFFGADPTGFYRQAQQLMGVPIEQLNGPIQSVSQPALSMLQDDPERYQRYYRKMVFLIGLATMPLAALAAVYAEEIVRVVLGPKWLASVPLFRVFALAAFIRPVLGTTGLVLITSGRSDRLLHFAWYRNATVVLFTAIGLAWGAMGVAMGQLAATLVLLVPCLCFSFAQSPVTVRSFFTAIQCPAIASGVMTLVLLLLRPLIHLSSFASLAWGCLAGAISYFGILFALPSSRGELQRMLVAGMEFAARRGFLPGRNIPGLI